MRLRYITAKMTYSDIVKLSLEHWLTETIVVGYNFSVQNTEGQIRLKYFPRANKEFGRFVPQLKIIKATCANIEWWTKSF